MGPAEPPEPSCSQPGPSSGALHLALSNSAVSASAVSLLLDAQPDDAFLADKDDLLPLHIALRHGASLEVVSLLLKASPDAAGDEECGALPLHFALAAGAPEAVIAVLLDAYPEATCLGSAVTVRLHRDDQAIVAGRLPLHLAVSFGHSAATVRRLRHHHQVPLSRTVQLHVYSTPPPVVEYSRDRSLLSEIYPCQANAKAPR